MKKILVVDDDYDILQIIEVILVRKGFHVKTHMNGFDLDAIIHEYLPDLILLDVRLPGGLLGTEICKDLKQRFLIPIVLFSAEQYVGFKECNADDFIKKPFDVKHLLEVLNSQLNRVRA